MGQTIPSSLIAMKEIKVLYQMDLMVAGLEIDPTMVYQLALNGLSNGLLVAPMSVDGVLLYDMVALLSAFHYQTISSGEV
jgi:hypothetical protein